MAYIVRFAQRVARHFSVHIKDLVKSTELRSPTVFMKRDHPLRVGLSNILDSDLGGRHPAERPHG